jgi:hypothetical protein
MGSHRSSPRPTGMRQTGFGVALVEHRGEGLTRTSSGGLGIARPGEQIVDKAMHQSVQFLNISVAPVGERRSAESHPGGIERSCELLTTGRKNGFLDASVFRARTSLDQTQLGQLCHLSTHGRVITTCSIGEVDNSNWFEPLDADEERKQGTVQRDSRFFEKNFVALGQIAERDEVDEGFVQATNGYLSASGCHAGCTNLVKSVIGEVVL